GQGGAAGPLHDRGPTLADRNGLRVGRRGGSVRRGAGGQDGGRAQVDGRGLGLVVAGGLALVGVEGDQDDAGPVGFGHGGQGGGLGDQLRLCLAHQGVLIDAQEDGAEPRQDGREQQDRQQDGA